MLEIRHLKTLHALRETDSLVEAAERLHLTQSALSHQFKELEERLGVQLFVRKTRPVRFTSAGCGYCNWPIACCRNCAAPSAIWRGWPVARRAGCTWRSNATAAFSG